MGTWSLVFMFVWSPLGKIMCSETWENINEVWESHVDSSCKRRSTCWTSNSAVHVRFKSINQISAWLKHKLYPTTTKLFPLIIPAHFQDELLKMGELKIAHGRWNIMAMHLWSCFCKWVLIAFVGMEIQFFIRVCQCRLCLHCSEGLLTLTELQTFSA